MGEKWDSNFKTLSMIYTFRVRFLNFYMSPTQNHGWGKVTISLCQCFIDLDFLSLAKPSLQSSIRSGADPRQEYLWYC